MYHHKASCISCIARGMEIDTTLRWYRGQGSTCQHRRFKRRRFGLWVRKNSWRRKWQPALVFLPGKFHEQRSLTDYSLWDSKELDTTEHARTHTHTHTHTRVKCSVPGMRHYWVPILAHYFLLSNLGQNYFFTSLSFYFLACKKYWCLLYIISIRIQ